MKISEVIEKVGLEVCCGNCEEEVFHGCCGDLLSEVMSHAKPSSIWVTVQSHVNIVAVAAISGIKAVVLCNDHNYPQETLLKAEHEKICLLKSKKSPFEVAGLLYSIGIKP
ncbi:iron-sulfur binding hydrogenase [Pseudothermotoga sp. U03pept]|uniref:iron-sulfur binding hydrogenase n=1 Tax=Pseudothermotoga sp. U03pept TaxID=3447012 RepID=UPI003EFDDB37